MVRSNFYINCKIVYIKIAISLMVRSNFYINCKIVYIKIENNIDCFSIPEREVYEFINNES